MAEFKIPDGIIDSVLRNGLILVANKGYGKTNALKILIQQLLIRNDIRAKIFDPVGQFRFNFIEIPYLEINENTPNLIYNVNPFCNLLHDIGFIDPTLRRLSITDIIMRDFAMRRDERIANFGSIPNWVVYAFEECQNLIGTYALSGNIGKFWLAFVSECRNYNMSYIMTTQRLADVSTKALERCGNYLFGKQSGDNDLKKIKRIAGEQIMNKVKMLDIGEFIYWEGNKGKAMQSGKFPLFKSDNHPYPIPKKKSFWVKILGL